MKLQKRLSRKYKNKTYHKYLVNIPGNDIYKSGLREGDDLKVSIKKNKLILEKVK